MIDSYKRLCTRAEAPPQLRALRMVAARRDPQLDPIEIMHHPVDAHRRKMREQITDCLRLHNGYSLKFHN